MCVIETEDRYQMCVIETEDRYQMCVIETEDRYQMCVIQTQLVSHHFSPPCKVIGRSAAMREVALGAVVALGLLSRKKGSVLPREKLLPIYFN